MTLRAPASFTRPYTGIVTMRPVLIMGLGRHLGAAQPGRWAEEIEIRRVPVFPTPAALDADRPTVVLLDRALLSSLGMDRERVEAVARQAALVGVGDAGDMEPPADFPTDLLTSFIPGGSAPGALQVALRGAFRHAASLLAERSARTLEQQRYHDITELTRVGAALSNERDLMALLELILDQARRLTTSDAGSLYLVDRGAGNGTPAALRFMLAQNSSLPGIPLRQFTIPIDHTSLSGYAAATGEPLVIADVYLLADDVEYRQNRSFDEQFGYRTKSMLVIPMKTHRDEVIGVLQLINRKRRIEATLPTVEAVEREVLSYDQRSVELVSALASQAAVAIENSRLYEDIERLFEGFVTASVTAIEARDPTTSGHSGRVAQMTVSLAEAVDRGGEGPYRALRFTREQLREIRYAGLLHDFGKVGVREQVLVKEKKLYPADLDVIKHRFNFLLQSAELEFERRRAEHLLRHGRERYPETVADMERELRKRRVELERYLQAIIAANEPTILPEESSALLAHVSQITYTDIHGENRPLLAEDELRLLSIPKGNLDDEERREIESHVTHTFRFLQQIPWTRELRGVADIAYGHHEKLNGAGYPRRIRGAEILPQTRMMTIADIFDALTAGDRPYKRAVSPDGALDILHLEANEGLIDPHLLRTFVQARVWDGV
ncbi:MAG TPA: HD domain-containing phosphohydrolase, partial [Gemmatimonadaceae bacterium]|nr:HD domain-containing phosphohydrolase [Gemmatimonadaceae bacterium]